ncbi:kinetochore protein NDC80 homolog [Eucalyptus grandis]|uniref:kinetochore protein NDC80 homolog n=1 Tax=Eucalyptus grandis TaxID=71139 RepID=UPI00192F0E35|nr:kinetochore protein NDC80 homolog [Eucalyptus grandis]
MIQLQTFNSRDAERMKKELQAVEGEIADAEIERNKYEEKCWDLDRALALKFKELEELAKECNKAVRKLKLGSDYQYVLNAKGSTPVEVMGIDYKSTLKPALDSHANDINKSSVEKLEELIILQQQSKKTAARIEEKRNRVVQLHSRVDDVST